MGATILSRSNRRVGRYRSKLEELVAKSLGPKWKYENSKIEYTVKKTYIPDFECDGVYVEVKGFFRAGDQAKYLAIRDDLFPYDFVFVFSDPNKKVRKGAKMTMGEWAEKHGITWYSLSDLKKLKQHGGKS